MSLDNPPGPHQGAPQHCKLSQPRDHTTGVILHCLCNSCLSGLPAGCRKSRTMHGFAHHCHLSQGQIHTLVHGKCMGRMYGVSSLVFRTLCAKFCHVNPLPHSSPCSLYCHPQSVGPMFWVSFASSVITHWKSKRNVWVNAVCTGNRLLTRICERINYRRDRV